MRMPHCTIFKINWVVMATAKHISGAHTFVICTDLKQHQIGCTCKVYNEYAVRAIFLLFTELFVRFMNETQSDPNGLYGKNIHSLINLLLENW